MRGASKRRRSPLKRKPLRNPGESLQQERQRLIDDEWTPYVVLAVMLAFLAVADWIRWYTKTPPQPIVMSAVALLAIGYCIHKFFRVRKRNRALGLGLEGEKAVGQYLEELRSKGCRVFHDIVGNGFNIDHVVVSTHGIFVIETKTYSKPLRGRAVVEFDGERVLVNGREPDRNAATQVRALGRWLRDLLAESTGKRFPIREVVVFPGWYTMTSAKNRGDVWVLNPELLPGYIEREPTVLQPEDVALVSSRLVAHMQTVE